jgi:hypothetical protein
LHGQAGGRKEVPAARSAGGDDEEAEKRSEESGEEEEARSEGTGEVEWKEKGLCALRKLVNREPEPEPGGDGEAAGEVAPSSR